MIFIIFIRTFCKWLKSSHVNKSHTHDDFHLMWFYIIIFRVNSILSSSNIDHFQFDWLCPLQYINRVFISKNFLCPWIFMAVYNKLIKLFFKGINKINPSLLIFLWLFFFKLLIRPKDEQNKEINLIVR